MSTIPVVSVCMITYSQEAFIKQAIEGVLMQECDFNIELIIVDDCSLDSTNKIIQKIIEEHPRGSWIKYIRHKKNIGMMPNFIYALQQCNGKYIALCEGDDYWTDPLKLQKQVDFLETNVEYVLSFHKIKILKLNNDLVDDFITTLPENYENQEVLARNGNYIHTPSVVFRNVIQTFPSEFTITPIGDYFLYMLLSEHGKLHSIDEEMAGYREGVGIWSGESIYYRHFNTALTHALLVNVFEQKNNKMLVDVFLKRIQFFIEKFESRLVAEDLSKLGTHFLVNEMLYRFFLVKNNKIKSVPVSDIKSLQLLKIILLRLKKRIWKK